MPELTGSPAHRPIGQAEAAALLAPLAQRFGAHAELVLAVSGGPDSTALMLIAAMARDAGLTLTFSVGTLDHGLRPEAAGECAAVAAAAASLGLDAEILHPARPIARTGIQANARAARYDALVAMASRRGAAALLTAHTLDDQVETIAMRLLRGSDLAGLAGIPRHGHQSGLPVARPLLDMPKARLIATAEAAGLGYAQDPSNADHHFERVRIRALLPTLAAAGFTPARMLRLARRAADAADAIARQAAAILASATRDASATRIPALQFADAPRAVRTALAVALLENHADPAIPERRERSEALAEALAAAISARRPLGRTLRGALIRVDGGEIVVTRAPARRIVPSRSRAKATVIMAPSLGNGVHET